MMGEQRDLFGFEPLPSRNPIDETTPDRSRLAAKASPRVQSAVERRLLDTAVDIATEPADRIGYQHTVFCQTCMPYRDPGPEVRRWDRQNGYVSLRIEAGSAMHPRKKEYVDLPLPFGPRARVILIHLNREAMVNESPVIHVEDSLTAFVKRILGRDPNGREVMRFKNQLGALSASLVRLATTDGTQSIQIDTKVVSAYNLWAPVKANQRVLWPSIVRLSNDYFTSLMSHAVPLDERAVAALANSAMALDIYAWLAQRLHRVPLGRGDTISWVVLHRQFGLTYRSLRRFRQVFRGTLRKVRTQYPDAKIDETENGLIVRNSPPPVLRRLHKSIGLPGSAPVSSLG